MQPSDTTAAIGSTVLACMSISADRAAHSGSIHGPLALVLPCTAVQVLSNVDQACTELTELLTRCCMLSFYVVHGPDLPVKSQLSAVHDCSTWPQACCAMSVAHSVSMPFIVHKHVHKHLFSFLASNNTFCVPSCTVLPVPGSTLSISCLLQHQGQHCTYSNLSFLLLLLLL